MNWPKCLDTAAGPLNTLKVLFTIDQWILHISDDSIFLNLIALLTVFSTFSLPISVK